MTPSSAELPSEFLRRLQALETSYLATDDPIQQSGFGGGAERWRTEREPILEAVHTDGGFLDIGCANGYLLECLVAWARERGRMLIPFGLDHGPRLIKLAKERCPDLAPNYFVGNAWDWYPPRQFRYAYSLHDCVPLDYLPAYVRRLLRVVVQPGGRLILGAYGSRSQRMPPFDVQGFLRSLGLTVVGTATGGEPPVSFFAWVDRTST